MLFRHDLGLHRVAVIHWLLGRRPSSSSTGPRLHGSEPDVQDFAGPRLHGSEPLDPGPAGRRLHGSDPLERAQQLRGPPT
eukprot:12418602-Alexandrium_andersonii.AAC.1